MEITEVRIKLVGDNPEDRLRAFCSVTFDDAFVVRDLRIIEGPSGPFVSMPSRRITVHCSQCGCKNHLRAVYCNQCGAECTNSAPIRDGEGRTKLYADISHPINAACRDMIQERVLAAFREEQSNARLRDDDNRCDNHGVEGLQGPHETRSPSHSKTPKKDVFGAGILK